MSTDVTLVVKLNLSFEEPVLLLNLGGKGRLGLAEST